jgi:hypothetical protein
MMRLLAVTILASVASWATSAWAAEPAAGPAPKRRVLVFTMTSGFRHDAIPLAGEVWRSLAEKSGRFQVVVSDDPTQFEPQSLFAYDAVVFCLTSGELPLSDAGKKALLEFVGQGRGLVGIHSATDTFYKWPDFGEMMGAYFDGHPWDAGTSVTIRVEQPENPIAAPFGSQPFALTEETYQFREPYDRSKLTVLLSLDTNRTDMSKQGVNRKDNDFALAWIKPYGRGRVFYTALGHNQSVWRDPRFQAHLLAGLTWAMAGEGR